MVLKNVKFYSVDYQIIISLCKETLTICFGDNRTLQLS